MTVNVNLHRAKIEKNDEFYTQFTDVVSELKHYSGYFEDKVVFCNCDDPTYSAFWKYFHLNFAKLGLRKLISTHYDKVELTYKMEYEGGNDDNVGVGIVTPLNGNGDFRSQECLKLLDECDIVVTNPPFSKFRDFVNVLMAYRKKFVIIGNKNAITYKGIFSLIRDNMLWTGYRGFSGGMWFYSESEGKTEKIVDGRRVVNVPSIWFTNLDHAKRHEKLVLCKSYTPEEYPMYDNYDAINVNKVKDIPVDYNGVMGVPVTFLDKYCPEQFEIIGNEYTLGIEGGRGYVDGKRMYSRIFIKRR